MKDKRQELLTREKWGQRIGNLTPGDVLPEVPGLIKFQVPEITVSKEPDPDTGMHDLKFVISTSAIDRDDDVIDVNGWDLKNYKKNPVVLFGHDYRSLPVARATQVGVEDDKLVAVDRFTPKDMNPFGYMVYELVRGKFLRATSVGFKPRQYVFNDDHKGYDFSEQELLEHSLVPVPSNPESLQSASADGIDLMPYKAWAERILDDDPDADRVALWLPKHVVADVYAAVSKVAVSLTDTSTPDGDTITTTGEGVITVPDPLKDADPSTNNEPSEAAMEEAIKALSDVIRELNDLIAALPEKVADAVTVKLAEAKVKDTPEGEELTEEDIKETIADAVRQALAAKNGKLPD
jgi:HK97 family phage prohead protease